MNGSPVRSKALFPRLWRHLGVLLANTALLGPLCRALGAVPNLHCERAAREVRAHEEPEGIARLCGAAGRVGLGLAAGYDADRRREAAEGLGLHSNLSFWHQRGEMISPARGECKVNEYLRVVKSVACEE